MSAHPNLDREAFQTLLASAFSVQESGISKQSLSALVEIQALITSHESFDVILALIADRARTVADATGIAIGIFTGDQLVYRAGSGSAATSVGQHLTAVLSLSGHGSARKEILRVDNADSDARIEAAICRERPARALLILPIFHERVVAGVLEILFNDPHTFDDREIRTYRLMAGLVEDTMLSETQRAENGAQAAQPPTPAVRDSVDNTASVQVCGTPTVSEVTPTVYTLAKNQNTIRWPAKLTLLHDPRWTVDAALLVIIICVAAWISYHHRASPSIEGSPRLTAESPTPKPSATIIPKRRESKQQAPGGAESVSRVRSPFKRVRVGPNEIDDISEDVTIRHFRAKAAVPHPLAANKQFDIGDDVTVRIFTYAPTVSSKTRTVSRR